MLNVAIPLVFEADELEAGGPAGAKDGDAVYEHISKSNRARSMDIRHTTVTAALTVSVTVTRPHPAPPAIAPLLAGLAAALEVTGSTLTVTVVDAETVVVVVESGVLAALLTALPPDPEGAGSFPVLVAA